MVVHLGRLRVITKRKEGKCLYPHCQHDQKLLPGRRTVMLSVRGKIKDKSVIFWKSYHPECFGPWLLWKCEQIPASKDGRRSMELSSEDKGRRQGLVRTRARLIRGLREVKTGEKLDKLVTRISDLDNSIRETGYPVIPYTGRKSTVQTQYDQFVQEVKEHYKDPRRVPKVVYTRATAMGMEGRFARDMDTWYDEKVAQSKQGSDWEAEHEDEGE